ncbi:MAG: rhodanese-like domain-containing protein [Candidatus Krumholzibacteriota bacterium]|nr:rhodanese-like domain-containing protein [Candidatus Krumholzibacteriota bacterium]
MKIINTIFLTVLIASIAGCGGAGIDGRAPKLYADAKQMVREAQAGVDQINIDEFKAKMESDDVFFIIDVREPYEYDEDNIPGSVNIPRGLLEFQIADKKFWDAEGLFAPEKGEEIIVYGYKIERGPLAAESLVKLGFTNVKDLYGGWVVWEKGPEALEVEEEVVEEGGCGG